MGYVGTRILESVLLLAASVSGLVFLKLSQEHGRTGADGLLPLGDAVLARPRPEFPPRRPRHARRQHSHPQQPSPDGEARPGLARRLGPIGGALVLVCGALELYGLHLDAVVQALLTAPVAVYEMVLAVPLISRGFDEPVVVTGS